MATLATSYGNARKFVPGSNTTNAPDADLLIFANSIYVYFALLETPRVQRYAGGTFGASSLSVAGVRLLTIAATNMARLLAVRYEGTDATTTDGRLLDRFKDKGEFELERQTFPSTNGLPRCYFPERIASGYWNLYLHPATSAVDIYLSIEGEIEPQALTSSASTLLLTPGNIARFDRALAAVIALMLNRSQDFINGLFMDAADRKRFGDWLKGEEAKGMLVPRRG